MADLTPAQRRALQLRHLAQLAREEVKLRKAVLATLVVLAAELERQKDDPLARQEAVTQAEDEIEEEWLLLLLLLFGRRYDAAGGDPARRQAALDDYAASRRADLRNVLGQVAEGQDPEMLATRVARTEVPGGYNGGAHKGLQLAPGGPEGATKMWLSLRDLNVRPTHMAVDGQTVAWNAKFQVGGHAADYPGDPSLPANETCNCRCVLVLASDLNPIVAGVDVDDETLPNGWRGRIAGLDIPTGDYRMLMTPPGGLRTRQYPMSLTRKHVGSDDIWVGTIDYAWIETEGEEPGLYAEGTFDLGGEDGREVARQLVAGLETVSIDPDEVTWMQVFLDSEGKQVTFEEAVELDSEGFPVALKDGYKVIDAMSDWRLAGLAVVSIPAYDEARIEPVYDYVPRAEQEASEDAAFEEELRKRRKKGKRWPSYEEYDAAQTQEEAVVAAAVGGQTFNREFFADPKFEGPTPLTVTPEGRVYGHVALFDSCYMAPGGRMGCQKPPRGSDFSRFEVHAAHVGGGETIRCGVITFGEGHSSAGSLKASQRQYANLATVAAKVVTGEDQWGVWVSGEVVDEFRDRAYDLLLSPLSGHWEPDMDAKGKLRMIAAHVVVVPGYAVPRVAAAYDANGDVEAIVFAAPAPTVPFEPVVAAALDAVDPTEVPESVLKLIQLQMRSRLAKL